MERLHLLSVSKESRNTSYTRISFSLDEGGGGKANIEFAMAGGFAQESTIKVYSEQCRDFLWGGEV